MCKACIKQYGSEKANTKQQSKKAVCKTRQKHKLKSERVELRQ